MRIDFTTAITVLATFISFSSAFESSPASSSADEALSHITDEDGWFDLSVGVAMKTDKSSLSPLEKRSESPRSTPVILRRNHETGKLIWPRSISEALTAATRSAPGMLKRSLQRRTAMAKRAMKVMITWYDGQDLLNPSCFPDNNKWAPTDQSMVAAVTIKWPGKPPCGSFVKIQHHSDRHKHVIVRIVDTCGGCEPGSAHIDLTIGAFQTLYPQDVGLVENLKAKVVLPPSDVENWSQKVIDTYGPKVTLDSS